MKGKFIKLVLVLAVITTIVYFLNGFNFIGERLVINYLRHKQGASASLEHISLSSYKTVNIKEIVIDSIYRKEYPLLKLKTMNLDFSRDKSRGNKITLTKIHMENGIVYGHHLAKHLQLRSKAIQEERERVAKEEKNMAADEDKSSDTATKDGKDIVEKKTTEPKGDSKKTDREQTVEQSSSNLMRQLTLKNVTLDGGTVFVNLLIARKEIAVKIKDVNADFQVCGDRFVVNSLSWKMGPLTPKIVNREFDISVLSSPEKMRGVPKEVRGLFILVGILLGQGSV